MSELADIKSAILHLAVAERQALREWLQQIDEDPALLAAIDEADRSFAMEGGVSPEEIRLKLKTWSTG